MAIAKSIPKSTDKDAKKPKQGAFKRAVKLTINQFLERTPIHGSKHIIEPRANTYTKCYWIFLIIMALLCAIALMATFLIRYKSNPTRINIETNFGKIHEIEFPAVTFCNPNFIANSMVQGLINSLENFKDGDYDNNITKAEFIKRVKYLAGFTNSIEKFNARELGEVFNILEFNRFDVKLTMKKLAYPCEKLLFRCRWEGKIVNCKSLFHISETYQGYCCSFNIIKPPNSVSKEEKNKKVKKTQFFGHNMGLSVILNPLIEKDAMTSVNSEGMKILINEYNLFPSEKTIERMLPHKMETFVEIKPERTISSKTVTALPISDRGCVFENEFKLNYFPVYREVNCQVECIMHQTLKLCECLPYFYYDTDSIEICSIEKLGCIIDHRNVLKKIKAPENNQSSNDCNCPSQCESTSYQIRMSSTDIMPSMSIYNIDPFHYNLTEQHMIVHVYFVSQFYRIYIRSLLTNFISLISNLGGVYSLLMGMSIISAFECIYFPTVRLYVNYRKIREEDSKPKTFSQRLDKVTIKSLKVPRLDTAKSDISDISGFRVYSSRHY